MVGQDTVYNLSGQVAKTTDRYNQTTRYFYNRNGELSCTCYADGKLAFTVTHYVNGQRKVVTEDPHNSPLGQGEAVSGTRVVYDAAGRPIRTERLTGITIIDSTQGAVANTATSPDTVCDTSYNSEAPATVLSATSTEYYADGRVWKTTDGGRTGLP